MQKSHAASPAPSCTAPGCPGQPGHITVAHSKRVAVDEWLKVVVFFSPFSHFPEVVNVTAGLLGVSGYFPNKRLGYLSDQGAYNLFKKVAEHFKNIIYSD